MFARSDPRAIWDSWGRTTVAFGVCPVSSLAVQPFNTFLRTIEMDNLKVRIHEFIPTEQSTMVTFSDIHKRAFITLEYKSMHYPFLWSRSELTMVEGSCHRTDGITPTFLLQFRATSIVSGPFSRKLFYEVLDRKTWDKFGYPTETCLESCCNDYTSGTSSFGTSDSSDSERSNPQEGEEVN